VELTRSIKRQDKLCFFDTYGHSLTITAHNGGEIDYRDFAELEDSKICRFFV